MEGKSSESSITWHSRTFRRNEHGGSPAEVVALRFVDWCQEDMKWSIFKVVALHQSIRMLVDDMTNCRKSDRLHQRQQMQWDVSLCIWHGTKTGRAISSTLGDRWTMSNKDFLLKRPSRSSKVKVAWYIWFGKADGSLTKFLLQYDLH
jgi:hypothetical protein